MVTTHADRLLAFLGSARTEVVLVAPFMKLQVVQACMNAIGEKVPVRCYTRWDPLEVASGVSDPEIVEIPRLQRSIRLVSALHAKVYIADGNALVGSANLTQKALGLHVTDANLEFLTDIPTTAPDLVAFLQTLDASAVDATANFAAAVREHASLIASDSQVSDKLPPTKVFYPTGRDPSRLIPLYLGEEPSTPTDLDVKADILRLRIPPGLSSQEVRDHILRVFTAHPDLTTLFETGSLSTTTVEGSIVRELGVDAEEASHRTKTLTRWLAQFAGTREQPTAWNLVIGKEFRT